MSDSKTDLPAFKSTGFHATIDRALEKAYKAGFDAGIKHQKQAAPPPKARELAKQLEAARDAAAEAFDAALQAFGQVQEQLAVVTAERDELRAAFSSSAQAELALADVLHEALDTMELHFDGAPDSSTKWLGALMHHISEALPSPIKEAVLKAAAIGAVTEQERKHCRCGRLSATMNDYMSAPPDLREDKRGLCWAEWTGEACR